MLNQGAKACVMVQNDLTDHIEVIRDQNKETGWHSSYLL